MFIDSDFFMVYTPVIFVRFILRSFPLAILYCLCFGMLSYFWSFVPLTV